MAKCTNKQANPIPVMFDTNILRGMNPIHLTPEFRLLRRLQEANEVKLLASKIAYNEWASHLINETTKKTNDLRRTLKKLVSDPGSSIESLDQFLHTNGSTGDEAFNLIENTIDRNWDGVLNGIGLNVEDLDPNDTNEVFKLYFKGKPPFKDLKNRNDIPDAFIFRALSRVHQEDPRTIFVCGDGTLSDTAKSIGCKTVSTINDLIQLEEISSLSVDHEFNLWWEQNLESVVSQLRDDEDYVIDEFQTIALSELEGIEVTHFLIPEDNSTATISYAYDFTNIIIDWDNAQSIGEGVLSVGITFESFLEVWFYVYRGDAFDVPSWVEVSLGDFEDDHYFDASGTIHGKFNALLSIEIDPSVKDGKLNLEELPMTLSETEFVDLIQPT